MISGIKFKPNGLAIASTIAMVAAAVSVAVPVVRSQSPSTVRIDGSSTVFPITEAAEDGDVVELLI